MRHYGKALTGALLVLLGGCKVALSDGHISAEEWFGIAESTVAALAVVWAVPNVARKHRAE